MLMFNEKNQTVRLDGLTQPMLSSHFWVLNLPEQDFMLTPLLSLEQTTGPALELLINEYTHIIPTSWNLLICDEHTLQLDVIPVAEMAGREMTAFAYGPNVSYPQLPTVTVVNYHASVPVIGPQLTKQQMLCHPISRDQWICISPTDGYNRHLKHAVAGNLV